MSDLETNYQLLQIPEKAIPEGYEVDGPWRVGADGSYLVRDLKKKLGYIKWVQNENFFNGYADLGLDSTLVAIIVPKGVEFKHRLSFLGEGVNTYYRYSLDRVKLEAEEKLARLKKLITEGALR